MISNTLRKCGYIKVFECVLPALHCRRHRSGATLDERAEESSGNSAKQRVDKENVTEKWFGFLASFKNARVVRKFLNWFSQ